MTAEALKFMDVNSAQVSLFERLLAISSPVSPRNLPTREILAIGFEITNPRRRVTDLQGRKWSSSLAVGELCWQLRGARSADILASYVPRWRSFADEDGQIRGSCYGYQIFRSKKNGLSQWDWVKRILEGDRFSRRAILSFQSADFLDRATWSKDVACASTMQFFIRDGELSSLVSMRSNDAVYGLPYDLFVFTSLQEMMAVELGVGLGSYFHHCGSLHFYEYQNSRIDQVLRNSSIQSREMMPIVDLDGRKRLLRAEKKFRKTGFSERIIHKADFWDDCIQMLVK